jgi:hypothetical protein
VPDHFRTATYSEVISGLFQSYMRLLDVLLELLLNCHKIKLVDRISRLILPGADQS